MPNYQSRLQFLYQRFISDEASGEEVREFWELINRADEADPIKNSVLELYDDTVPEEIERKNWAGAVERMINEPDDATLSKEPRGRAVKWWAAAASVALLLGIFSYFNSGNRLGAPAITGSAPDVTDKQDVPPPSSNRATIMLADGTKIFLDSTGNGMFAMQNNVKLKKTGDGKIVYDKVTDAASDKEIIYNTLNNPKGSRAISTTLSDGSQLWLNSGSSVTFPVAFNGPQRKVSITGEAYFEVARDPSKKFIVMANGVATEVLGTHFNVNAYGDRDAVHITLLEGSVKVIAPDGSSAMIKPGAQVAETMDGKLKMKPQVDVEEVTAWKNEMFRFNNTGIKDIMKEVSRWYDVDIEYKGKFDELGFGGNMSRQKNVSELLKRLEATQAVKFEVNGRRITVVQTK